MFLIELSYRDIKNYTRFMDYHDRNDWKIDLAYNVLFTFVERRKNRIIRNAIWTIPS